MNLLELEGMTGVPAPEVSHIQEFANIINRDSSEEQQQAAMELAYIHFMVHYESAYASWDEEIRSEKVINDIWGKDSNWKPDEVVNKAMIKYAELTQSEYVRLLQAARDASNKLITYFKDLDLTKVDKNGNLIHKAKDVIANISKVGEVVEGIDKLKEQIKKHESKESSNRAGVKTNKYSEG